MKITAMFSLEITYQYNISWLGYFHFNQVKRILEPCVVFHGEAGYNRTSRLTL